MSLNTTPRTWVSGEVVTAAMMNTEVRDALTGIQAAHGSYTPSWTAATTNPTLNNGTLTGLWTRFGKTAIWRFILTCGSTTAFGSGTYFISLPSASGSYVQNQSLSGNGATAQSGATAYSCGVVRYTTSTVVYFSTPTGTTASNTVPFTFVSTSILAGGGDYELA